MKYLILIYANPSSRKIWDGFSDAERAEGWRQHRALADELAASGALIVSGALADASLATRVSVRQGRTTTSDGPFAEAKELVAGFYLVECDSAEHAIEFAARVPEATLDLVEVRPVMDTRGLEM